MADKKITQLTSYPLAIDTDVLPIVDITGNETKKISIADLKAIFLAFGMDINLGANNLEATYLDVSTSALRLNNGSGIEFYIDDKATLHGTISVDFVGKFQFGNGSANTTFDFSGVSADHTYTFPDHDGAILVNGDTIDLDGSSLVNAGVVSLDSNGLLINGGNQYFWQNGQIMWYNGIDNLDKFGSIGFTLENQFTIESPIGGIQAHLSITTLTETQVFQLPDHSGIIAMQDDVVPYTGANGDLDLGVFSVIADNFNAKTSVSLLNNSSIDFYSDDEMLVQEAYLNSFNGSIRWNDTITSNTVVIDTSVTGGGTYTIPNVPSGTFAMEATTAQVSSGGGAPASTPTKVGDIYVDISAMQLYFAVGNSSSADWVLS